MNRRLFSTILALSFLVSLMCTTVMAQGKLEQIKERGFLLGATVNFSNAPFSFKDESGKTIGMEVDLLQAIADKIGVKLELVEIPWESGVTRCWDKDYEWDLFDVVAGTVTIKPERAEICGFSDPYYATGQAILTTKASGIKGKNDIKAKKIGAMKGSTGYECTKTIGDPVPFDTYCDIVDALKMSIVSASIMDKGLAVAHAKDNPSLIVLDELLTDEKYGVAYPKGDDELLALLNEVVEEQKESLNEKWDK